MRARRFAGVATTAALALASVGLTAAPAVSEGEDVWATVTDVVATVSRTGGITVTGKINCAAAVALWAQSNPSGLPPQSQVMVNIDWTAYQATSRKRMVTASFGDDIMSPCYDSDNPTAYMAWTTNHAGSSKDFYVFSDTGKFVKGPVHVDVIVNGGFDPNDGSPSPNVISGGGFSEIAVEVFSHTGFDVKANVAVR
jgi:hypothetical protein